VYRSERAEQNHQERHRRFVIPLVRGCCTRGGRGFGSRRGCRVGLLNQVFAWGEHAQLLTPSVGDERPATLPEDETNPRGSD
jgi:hypothetical protein